MFGISSAPETHQNIIGQVLQGIPGVHNLSDDQQRRPTNAAEVRSFLGLVNYCGRFIPNLATTFEPLRRLTRQSSKWTWASEKETAFLELKRQLASSHGMAHFKQDAETHVAHEAANSSHTCHSYSLCHLDSQKRAE